MSTLFVDYRVHHSSPEGILVQLPSPHGGFGKLTKETLGNDLLAERLLKAFATRSHVPALLTNNRDAEGYRMLTIDLTHGWSDLYTYPVCIQQLVPQLLRKHLLIGLGITTGAKLVKQSDKGLVFNISPNTIAVAAYEKIEDTMPFADHATIVTATDTTTNTIMNKYHQSKEVVNNVNASRSSVKIEHADNELDSDEEKRESNNNNNKNNNNNNNNKNNNNNNNNNNNDDGDEMNNSTRIEQNTVNNANALSNEINAEVIPLTSRALHEHVHTQHPRQAINSDAGAEYRKIIEVRVLNYDVGNGIVNVTTQHDVVEHTPLDTSLAMLLLQECPAGRRIRGKVLLSSTDDGVAVIEIPITLPSGEVFSIIGYYIYNWSVVSNLIITNNNNYNSSNSNNRNNNINGNGSNTKQSSTVGSAASLEEEPPILNSIVECVIEFAPPHPALQEWMPFVVVSNRSSFMPVPRVRSSQWLAQASVQLEHLRKELSCTSEALLQTVTPNTMRKQVNNEWCVYKTNEQGWQVVLDKLSDGLVGHLPWRQNHYNELNSEVFALPEEVENNASRKDLHVSDDNDYSEEDDDDDGGKYNTHKMGTEKDNKVRRRKLEEAIDAYERNMNELTPSSPDEFQRLLLATPNSSYLWTQYMAFHVNLQQFEHARQVAERALTTIHVREQDERRNVWVAYLNIENLYGTAESLAAIFRRALQQEMEEIRLYECLADIYASSRKGNQLLALCRTMTNKFRHERRAWTRLGDVLVDQEKRDQLKRMLKDMSAALKRDDATLVVVHIAIHEYKHGSVENGRALFDTLLSKLPKRSDVWSAYIDQEYALLKRRDPQSSLTHVRQLFERAVVMNFNAKVMQQFLTRFLNFEKEHGNAAEVEKVKERARAYVQAKVQAVTDAGVV